jgi:hypothetical protein
MTSHTALAISASFALLLPGAPARAEQGVDISIAQPDFTTWQLFGSATAQNLTPGNGFTYSLLNLTQAGTGDQGGAGFAATPLALDFDQSFSFSFNFYIPVSEGIRGDGMTLTLATAPGLGNAGSGLGYEGLGAASVALAIDTFHFDGEPVSPSLQILSGGSITPLAATETGLGDSIRDPDFQWFARLAYVPSGNGDQAGVLTGSIEHINLGTFSVTANIDFAALGLAGNPVYYGFTASNGLATDGHVVDWGAPAPVPEPGSALLMLAGAMALAGWRRRR